MAPCKPRQLVEGDLKALEAFECGVSIVDEWLHNRAASSKRSGTAVTYVTADDDGIIAGFFTLSCSSVAREDAGGWLARNTPSRIPVILLGMLGVDKRYQGIGIGSDLLAEAYRVSSSVSGQIGAKAIVVEPYGDEVRSFYERHGFKSVPRASIMFMKIP